MPATWCIAIMALLLQVLGASPSARAADPLSLGIPGNTPFTGLDGTQVTGVIAEATVSALSTMGYTVAPRLLPFKRMYQWVHTGQLDVAVSVLATPERMAQAHYSLPIVTEYTLVMVPKGRAFPLTHVADLHGKKLGGQLGFLYPQLAGIVVELLLEKDYETNLQKIALGKLDGVLIGSITGPFLARRLGLLDSLEPLPTAIGEVPLGAAFSKSVFSPEALMAFNAAIARLHASVAWQKILAANGVAELVKPWPIASQ
ncbi:MAG: substrate-binding periplasmic protein [Candidatus Tectimicrobiota bacterium]